MKTLRSCLNCNLKKSCDVFIKWNGEQIGETLARNCTEYKGEGVQIEELSLYQKTKG